jgi:hypothetical protein
VIPPAPEIQAARSLAAEAAVKLRSSPDFQRLGAAAQANLLRDLGRIRGALAPQPAPLARATGRDPYSFAMETPADLRRRLFAGSAPAAPAPQENAPATPPAAPRKSATETLAQRTGALIDEVDFPGFVAGLIHGTFDAMVNAAIRQMEAFAGLVSAVAKNVDDFTRDNVTANQARDWLVEHHPRDVVLDTASMDAGQPVLRARRPAAEGEEEIPPPPWLAEFGLEGEELTDELLEEQIVPAVRRHIGETRQQTLATMVLLGMNRIVVRDGSISARVRFRAAASDRARVDYAVSQDPGGGGDWGQRGSAVYSTHTTMISTVGVNAQTDQSLNAELFGEVKINFASETLPLDRFADDARVALVQRHARQPAPPSAPVAPPAGALPSVAAVTPVATPPAVTVPATPIKPAAP